MSGVVNVCVVDVAQSVRTDHDQLCPKMPPFPLLLLLIMFLDLLTTIVGGRVLLTDIVTIFCIQRVSLTNSASKPSYRFAIKKAQNASHLFPFCHQSCINRIYWNLIPESYWLALKCYKVITSSSTYSRHRNSAKTAVKPSVSYFLILTEQLWSNVDSKHSLLRIRPILIRIGTYSVPPVSGHPIHWLPIVCHILFNTFTSFVWFSFAALFLLHF